MSLSRKQLLDMLRMMWRIRCFEEKVIEIYRQGLIRGPVHPYIGEEAVAVGACSALKEGDVITSTHRGHGHCLAKGGDPKLMMAELLGKATGYCKGKGGSMHIAAVELGILGANGVVGGSMGIATGAAFAHRYKGTDGVALCFFGDGALGQGVFHEAATLAALWKVPVIYLCEDNGFAQWVRSEEMVPVSDFSLFSSPYGFPGVNVDGNDVLAVYEAAKEAVERARAGHGPTLIVAKTYRLHGHTITDPATYRTQEEVQAWWAKEPISRFASLLVGWQVITDAEAEAIHRQERALIEQALEFALASEEPSVDDLYRDVYA